MSAFRGNRLLKVANYPTSTGHTTKDLTNKTDRSHCWQYHTVLASLCATLYMTKLAHLNRSTLYFCVTGPPCTQVVPCFFFFPFLILSTFFLSLSTSRLLLLLLSEAGFLKGLSSLHFGFSNDFLWFNTPNFAQIRTQSKSASDSSVTPRPHLGRISNWSQLQRYFIPIWAQFW